MHPENRAILEKASTRLQKAPELCLGLTDTKMELVFGVFGAAVSDHDKQKVDNALVEMISAAEAASQAVACCEQAVAAYHAAKDEALANVDTRHPEAARAFDLNLQTRPMAELQNILNFLQDMQSVAPGQTVEQLLRITRAATGDTGSGYQ